MAGRPWNADKSNVVLTEGQEAFLDWLVDPARVGSQNELADKIGVNRSTLSKWKKDIFFKRAWDKRLAELNIEPERIQAVVENMYQAAIGSGPQAIKAAELYLRYVDRFTPKQEIVSSSSEATEMTDEELASAAENIIRLRQSG